MKKIIFFLLTAAVFTACSTDGYKINVKSDMDSLNGSTIMLQALKGDEWIEMSKSTIEKNKFSMEGEVDSATIAYIWYENASEQVTGYKLFILEKGKINLKIDNVNNITVKGTKMNDILQSFEDDLKNITTAEFMDSLNNDLYTEREINKRFDAITLAQKNLTIDFLSNNINSLPGIIIFVESYELLNLDDKAKVIELMNESTKENNMVKSIVEITKNEIQINEKVLGTKYTDFRMADPQGNYLSLSDFIGKSDYLLIDFWASWCGPCIKSFPDLRDFYNKYKGQNFDILGVSLDDNNQQWINAIEKHELSWHHVSDLKGWHNEAARLYNISSIPRTILFDKDGTIIGINLKLSEIRNIIEK